MVKADKIIDNLKYHIVDSTAMLAFSLPIYTAFEKLVIGMSDDVSINTRIYGAVVAYAGGGWLISKGRDMSKRLFKINDKTKERIQQIHDSAYLAAINIPAGAALYIAAGETDIKKIALGTGMSVAFGAFMGPWVGYAIDSFRDLTGLKKCERRLYHKFIQNLRPAVKKGLAVALTTISIGVMGLIYSLTPDNNKTDAQYKRPAIEQTVSKTNYKSASKSLEKTTQETFLNQEIYLQRIGGSNGETK